MSSNKRHNSMVSLEIEFCWQDGYSRHVDRRYFAKANLWRDIFPAGMDESFPDPKVGDQLRCRIPSGELLEVYDPANIKTINNNQFNRRPRRYLQIEPQLGRFYPRNFLINVAGINSDDRRIMRIMGLDYSDPVFAVSAIAA